MEHESCGLAVVAVVVLVVVVAAAITKVTIRVTTAVTVTATAVTVTVALSVTTIGPCPNVITHDKHVLAAKVRYVYVFQLNQPTRCSNFSSLLLVV